MAVIRDTLGIVLIAKKRGLIPKARPVIEDMIKQGFIFQERWLINL